MSQARTTGHQTIPVPRGEGNCLIKRTSLLKNSQMDEFNLLCVLHLRSEVTMQDGGFRG
jgi:hypothetical protein